MGLRGPRCFFGGETSPGGRSSGERFGVLLPEVLVLCDPSSPGADTALPPAGVSIFRSFVEVERANRKPRANHAVPRARPRIRRIGSNVLLTYTKYEGS
jgi:hypothetical protein